MTVNQDLARLAIATQVIMKLSHDRPELTMRHAANGLTEMLREVLINDPKQATITDMATAIYADLNEQNIIPPFD
jgi:hypothetical protein